MTGIERLFNATVGNDERVLSQVYVQPRRLVHGFAAWFAFWSDGSQGNNAFSFIKPRGIKEKLIESDSAISKIFACLKAGCKVRIAFILCKKFSNDTVCEARFEMKLSGTEVILEPVA